MIKIEYINEKTVSEDDLSLDLLKISLKNKISHIYACGGFARCSTCRVLVTENLNNLEPRNEAEAQLAKLKGLEDNIRLACQTRVKGPVKLRRLVLDDMDSDLASSASDITSGKEKPIAVLFSDIRDFTQFSEKQLPYDIIHILSRYFSEMGEAVIQNNGYIDKYIGDGLMAIFGIDENNPETTCLSAISCGLAMLEKLVHLNSYLKENFDTTFNIGIGIHFGEAVIGEVGHKEKRQFTALGDSVNFASRVESATKSAGVSLLITEAVYNHVKAKITIAKNFNAELKGKSGQYLLYQVTGIKKNM